MTMRIDGHITPKDFRDNLYRLSYQLVHQEDFTQKLKSEINLEISRIKFWEEQIKEINKLVKNWSTIEFERKRSTIETITRAILIDEKDVQIELSIDLHKLLLNQNEPYHLPFPLTSTVYRGTLKTPYPKNYPQRPSTIGEHIKKKRIDSNLTQAEVGNIIGVSTDCITYWENNRSKPQIAYYPRIHHFLGYCAIDFDETNIQGRLRSYRLKHGISCKDLARLLKVNASTVRAWEKGVNKPSRKRMDYIEAFLVQR